MKRISIYFKPRILIMILLGCASGLPLLLTGSTLTVWLTEIGTSRTSIGLFTIVALPYSLKFLWAPLMDFVNLPILSILLGRRKSWLVFIQFFLIITIIMMALSQPEEQLYITAITAVLVAICSASQDIIIDAYRIELLDEKEQSIGVSAYLIGYRLGMIIAGAQALFMAEFMDWSYVYIIMAIIMTISMSIVIFLPEPNIKLSNISSTEQSSSESTLQTISTIFRNTIINPLQDFASKDGWIAILLFVTLFKVGAAFAGHMANPFYLDLGFSKSEIATIVKTYGIIATILGSIIGGWIIYKLGFIKAVWLSGIAQIFAILMHLVQEYYGDNNLVLILTISFEDLISGIGTAVLLTFVSNICTNPQYTATQYSIISSLSSIGRTFIASGSGFVVEHYGWTNFYIFSALLSVPALLLLPYFYYKKIIK